jgi:hypothetical protein
VNVRWSGADFVAEVAAERVRVAEKRDCGPFLPLAPAGAAAATPDTDARHATWTLPDAHAAHTAAAGGGLATSFVLVLHLDPKRESMMRPWIARTRGRHEMALAQRERDLQLRSGTVLQAVKGLTCRL